MKTTLKRLSGNYGRLMRSVNLIFLGIAMFSGLRVSAQSTNLRFDHITVNQGLTQTTINCIEQDPDGFLWMGTQNGLNKYYGYGFETFYHDPVDENSISENWIIDVDADKSGNIWIATKNGLNYIEKKSKKIFRYFPDDNDPFSIADDEIFAVHVDRKGFVWAKTANGLNRLDTATGKFTYFEHYFDLFDHTNKSDFGFPIMEDEFGNIWTGSAYGLFCFNTKFEQFIRYSSSKYPMADNYVSSIIIDKKGEIVFGTKKGAYKLNRRKKKITPLFPDNPTMQSFFVTVILEDHNGDIWLGTKHNGLVRYERQTGKMNVYQYESTNIDGVSDSEILTLFEDKSQILWVGTGTNGLDKLDMKKKKFQLYRKSTSKHSVNLSSNIIGSIFKNDDGKLWIGTWSEGLDIYDRETGQVDHFSADLNGKKKIAGDNVHVICKDIAGRIWLGTISGISINENGSDGFQSLQDYFPNLLLPKLNGTRIYAMCEDRYENMWVGTGNGLYRFNIKKQIIESFFTNTNLKYPDRNICSNKIYTIMIDKEGYLWIGTNNGLSRFNILDGRFYNFKADGEDVRKSMSNNNVYSVIEGSDGYIWIGTSSGLNRLNKSDSTFVYYTKKNGLPNDLIYEMIEDHNSMIWLSTGRGIARFDPKTEEIIAFSIDDGLQNIEFNNGASHKAFDGEIFFGGIDGFNSFYPDSMSYNKNIPPIIITRFVKTNALGNEEVFLEGVNEVEVSYQDYMFTIEFAALEFTKPERNRYKYMMKGSTFDSWVYIGTDHSKSFSNLPAGDYEFKVIGSNNDLEWNEVGASLKIVITPPWWRSNWAYLTYIFVIGAVIYYFIELRTRKLRKSNQVLRDKQMAALEIAKQKEELAIKNKNITDSINYAKRIQQAMMPSVYFFKKLFPESFILYRPKDIVSGDFYWIAEKNNKIFIAAVDCTGHGVPGAFMSIIGFDLLRNIIEKGIEHPAIILNQLNEGVANIFSKNAEEQTVKDGMDISLCVIDKTDRMLEYAGAINPLYLARDNKIIEIKGNRFSVGMLNKERETFESHAFPFKKNDMIYIFSDGYPDQFGGPIGKKFKYRRFRHLLLTIHNLSVEQQKEFLDENIDNWRGHMEQVDDMLVIGIKLTI